MFDHQIGDLENLAQLKEKEFNEIQTECYRYVMLKPKIEEENEEWSMEAVTGAVNDGRNWAKKMFPEWAKKLGKKNAGKKSNSNLSKFIDDAVKHQVEAADTEKKGAAEEAEQADSKGSNLWTRICEVRTLAIETRETVWKAILHEVKLRQLAHKMAEKIDGLQQEENSGNDTADEQVRDAIVKKEEIQAAVDKATADRKNAQEEADTSIAKQRIQTFEYDVQLVLLENEKIAIQVKVEKNKLKIGVIKVRKRILSAYEHLSLSHST